MISPFNISPIQLHQFVDILSPIQLDWFRCLIEISIVSMPSIRITPSSSRKVWERKLISGFREEMNE